jgi:hypothetical protein
MEIRVTSLIPSDYRDELEQLFFFNSQQATHRSSIVRSVEKYGSPRLVERLGGLRIEIPRAAEAQTLYAIADAPQGPLLAGVVVYTRFSNDELEILHMAVDSTEGPDSIGKPVARILVEELCRIARRVKGIRSIRLPYERGRLRVEHEIGDNCC